MWWFVLALITSMLPAAASAQAGCDGAEAQVGNDIRCLRPKDTFRDYGGSARGANRNTTLEVGSSAPNAFGLHDMHGNVGKGVEDCYVHNYTGAPLDGSAATLRDCAYRVLRGGSWNSDPTRLRSANRIKSQPDRRILRNDGFRIRRALGPSAFLCPRESPEGSDRLWHVSAGVTTGGARQPCPVLYFIPRFYRNRRRAPSSRHRGTRLRMRLHTLYATPRQPRCGAEPRFASSPA
jgi:hypothetical protein